MCQFGLHLNSGIAPQRIITVSAEKKLVSNNDSPGRLGLSWGSMW